jgi:hypothetical protein
MKIIILNINSLMGLFGSHLKLRLVRIVYQIQMLIIITIIIVLLIINLILIDKIFSKKEL